MAWMIVNDVPVYPSFLRVSISDFVFTLFFDPSLLATDFHENHRQMTTCVWLIFNCELLPSVFLVYPTHTLEISSNGLGFGVNYPVNIMFS